MSHLVTTANVFSSARYSLILFLAFLLFSCGKVDTLDKTENHLKTDASTPDYRCIASQNLCEVDNEIGKFSIKFDRETILTELPFNVEITHEGTNKIEKVSAYMEGKEMFMGKVPVFFSSPLKEASGNQFVAESMLASCSEEFMTWSIHFIVTGRSSDGQEFSSTFSVEFDSKRLN